MGAMGWEQWDGSDGNGQKNRETMGKAIKKSLSTAVKRDSTNKLQQTAPRKP
jgi:hypothetical protein